MLLTPLWLTLQNLPLLSRPKQSQLLHLKVLLWCNRSSSLVLCVCSFFFFFFSPFVCCVVRGPEPLVHHLGHAWLWVSIEKHKRLSQHPLKVPTLGKKCTPIQRWNARYLTKRVKNWCNQNSHHAPVCCWWAVIIGLRLLLLHCFWTVYCSQGYMECGRAGSEYTACKVRKHENKVMKPCWPAFELRL